MTIHVPCRPYFVTASGLPPDAPDPQFKPGPRAATPNTWTFPEICAAYQWPANAPGTGVIAIGELGGGFGMAEMETYFKSIGQPMPTITVVSVDGTKNDNNSGDADIEVALDIQGAAASFFCATGRPAEIRVHLRGAIRNGISKKELSELCLHSFLYCGGPAALDAFHTISAALPEIEKLEKAAKKKR